MTYLPAVTLTWYELTLIIAVAVAAGAAAVFLYNMLRRRGLERHIEEIRNRSIRNPDYGRWKTDIPPDHAAKRNDSPDDRIVLESARIKNFKNIKDIKLDFTGESALTGRWTCIAGINGAGKSTILQALCLVLLGDDLVTELGRGRLTRMCRCTQEGTANAEIEVYRRAPTRSSPCSSTSPRT